MTSNTSLELTRTKNSIRSFRNSSALLRDSLSKSNSLLSRLLYIIESLEQGQIEGTVGELTISALADSLRGTDTQIDKLSTQIADLSIAIKNTAVAGRSEIGPVNLFNRLAECFTGQESVSRSFYRGVAGTRLVDSSDEEVLDKARDEAEEGEPEGEAKDIEVIRPSDSQRDDVNFELM